jgi:hypothetical protein
VDSQQFECRKHPVKKSNWNPAQLRGSESRVLFLPPHWPVRVNIGESSGRAAGRRQRRLCFRERAEGTADAGCGAKDRTVTIRWALGIGKRPQFSTNALFRHYPDHGRVADVPGGLCRGIRKRREGHRGRGVPLLSAPFPLGSPQSPRPTPREKCETSPRRIRDLGIKVDLLPSAERVPFATIRSWGASTSSTPGKEKKSFTRYVGEALFRNFRPVPSAHAAAVANRPTPLLRAAPQIAPHKKYAG